MRILIIDDDRLVAMSLKMIIEAEKELEVVATGHSGREAIHLYEDCHPDILLMDIRMDEMTGLEAGEEILKADPSAKILFLTTFNDDEYIVKALSIGAKGYIIKQEYESIVPALRAIEKGQTVFGSDVMERVPEMLADHKRRPFEASERLAGEKDFDYKSFGITEQEFEVIRCVSLGLSNKECAERLCLSEGTVRNYISSILSKLGLRDRTNLAIFYYTNIVGRS
ncbi:MAG: response regulator transcription factor [Lachnospiraceae bacterium]|nr:response regulator transcription factor [Lachnospiraceae bacterium]